MRRPLTLVAVVGLVAGLMACAAARPAAVPPASPVAATVEIPQPAPVRPPTYYLSLGDSIAFGTQPDQVAADRLWSLNYASYPELFEEWRPDLTLVNYACPGETTASMMRGGCPWVGTLHDEYDGPQFTAAKAFLRRHPGQVSLITIDVGTNDVLPVLGHCEARSDTAQCLATEFPTVLGGLQRRYTQMLTALRRLAPQAHIVLLNLYNPIAQNLPATDVQFAQVNRMIDSVAGRANAAVADAFTAINHAAGARTEAQSLCLTTWRCSPYWDIHPTDVGYGALTEAVEYAESPWLRIFQALSDASAEN